MSKKIVHITTVHPRNDVRIRYKYILSLSRHKDNFDTVLVVADGKGSEKMDNYVIKDLGKSGLGRIGRFVGGNYRVFIFGLKNKSDLMHFHDPELLPIATLFSFMGKKVVYDMHENLPFQILTKNYIPKFLRLVLGKTTQIFQRLVLYSMPVVFAENSYLKYFSFVKKREVVLNYPLKDIVGTIKQEKRNKFTVGYMGGVTEERGALIVLSTLKKLREEGEPVDIVFVGEVDEQVKNTAIYKISKQEGWADFKGRLEPIEGWGCMAQCHAGLAILENSPNYVESYPTKLFEYMLLKLPVITSNFPLYSGIINESKCGIPVNPSSVDEIADAIKIIKNHEEDAKLMGERGCSVAKEKYNWETEFSKVLSFYDKILQPTEELDT
ncbi:glycosyltransferase [Spongiimicrobium sp. 3-5]|uniref:glycosyltransferase n=1 Tax=Spongiimicrobium sp. 3-5 TaxID=3332596 RepID=UPI00398151BB